MATNTLAFLFLAGAIGAIVKDLIKDNSLELPKITDGKIVLGFLGSCFIGGAAGYLVDGSLVTAALAGYAGMSAIESFIGKKLAIPTATAIQVETIIREIAQLEGVDPDLAVRVAKCESSLIPSAINVNKNGSRDRGVFQINDKYHPEVSDEMATDIVLSTKFFCSAFKNGHLSWWDATKECWKK